MVTIRRNPEAELQALELKKSLLRKPYVDAVNKQTGDTRALFVTNADLQQLIYNAKEAEAYAYINSDPPPENLAEFPFLAAEIGIIAPTAYELAQIWINMSAQWRYVGAFLEGLRAGAIQQIEAATTHDELEAICAAFNFQVQQFLNNLNGG